MVSFFRSLGILLESLKYITPKWNSLVHLLSHDLLVYHLLDEDIVLLSSLKYLLDSFILPIYFCMHTIQQQLINQLFVCVNREYVCKYMLIHVDKHKFTKLPHHSNIGFLCLFAIFFHTLRISYWFMNDVCKQTKRGAFNQL